MGMPDQAAKGTNAHLRRHVGADRPKGKKQQTQKEKQIDEYELGGMPRGGVLWRIGMMTPSDTRAISPKRASTGTGTMGASSTKAGAAGIVKNSRDDKTSRSAKASTRRARLITIPPVPTFTKIKYSIKSAGCQTKNGQSRSRGNVYCVDKCGAFGLSGLSGFWITTRIASACSTLPCKPTSAERGFRHKGAASTRGRPLYVKN